MEPGQPNDLRGLFAGRAFIGSDLRPGPGVDRVEDLRALSFADASVGTALCLDTLEHCADPLAACREMHRVLIDGGVCVISSVMFFPVHAYPHDYWRFTPEGMALLLEPFDDVWSAGVGHPELPTQVVATAAKGEGTPMPRRSAALDRAQARVRPRRGQGAGRPAAGPAAPARPDAGRRAAAGGRSARPGAPQPAAGSLTAASPYWKTKNGASGVRASQRPCRSVRQSEGRRR